MSTGGEHLTPDGEPTVLVERHGPVGWLIFNRPGSGNAMNAAMIEALEVGWRELDADPGVRVIVN
ncbi:MAG: enoyl-CoA hydratase/isomerase family protein, partial [Acidimicrobiales bacterium]